MHLLDAWTSLAPLDLARLLGVPAAVLLATLLPGRRAARVAAIVAALCAAAMGELGSPAWVRAGWSALWLVVAWHAGVHDVFERRARRRAPPGRRAAIESGAVALPLCAVLAVLLLAAISGQSLEAADERRATLGAVTLGVGLLHLMMRRHARRAAIALAALGLGAELLAASARAMDVTGDGPPPGAALAATALALALAWRIALGRERVGGSPLVSDAHELHDGP